jgi:release factor glutamine methyltransferase
LTAEVLLLYAIRSERPVLRAHPERELTAVEQAHLARYLRDRLAGTPTQYITGRQEFWGLEIRVNPSVLIPRPETEHLVERTLTIAAELGGGVPLNSGDHAQPLQILDCGTGSGCLALALASELPRARIYASDISAPALQTARGNAVRLGLAESIAFFQADLMSAFPHASLDLVISNPPYIALSDAPTLAREVRDHEPFAALFAGPDGTAFYRRLIPEAARVLRPGGWAILELGFNVADSVKELFDPFQWTRPATDLDLAGIERVIYARRT